MMELDEFIKRLLDIAQHKKTLYVMGCFGSALTAANKVRYTHNHAYNMSAARTAKIMNASIDTFGFDCVNMIKGVLWGWEAKGAPFNYGGAIYKSNGVPDHGADQVMNKDCKDVSTDFSKIEVGEAVWLKGHIGVYIGDGLVIECTPVWKDGVQITACANIGKKTGYPARKWKKHGKLPWIDYGKETAPEEKEKPVINSTVTKKDWQLAAIVDGYKFPSGADGIWGQECEAVAKKAIVKRYFLLYKNKALTKVIQRIVGVDADGKFGQNTERAVSKWQANHGLEPDGIVGIKTWKTMFNV